MNKSYKEDRFQQIRRAAMQLSYFLLAHIATKDDAKSEQLHAKLVVLMFPQYRSHSEQLFRLQRGVFKRSTGFALQDMEFFDDVCKYAHAAWLALSWKPFEPSPGRCFEELSHVVHHLPTTYRQYALHFSGGDSWCGEMVQLISKLRGEFNMHSTSVLRCFHRWGGTLIPIELVNGANFEDCYVRVGRHARQRKKGVENQVYTTIPGRLRRQPRGQRGTKSFDL